MGSQEWASLVTQTVKHLLATWETRVRSLGQEDPLKKDMATQLQYSCLENSKDRGAWWATVQGVSKSRTQLSDFHFPFFKKWTVRAKGESTPQELKVTPLVTDPTVVAGLEGDQ